MFFEPVALSDVVESTASALPVTKKEHAQMAQAIEVADGRGVHRLPLIAQFTLLSVVVTVLIAAVASWAMGYQVERYVVADAAHAVGVAFPRTAAERAVLLTPHLQTHVHEMQQFIVLSVVGGFVVLYASLYALVRGAAIQLARQNAHLRESATRQQRLNALLEHTQEQVIRQERLRALGHMASGIAHDLNNALAPVVGFSELLLLTPVQLQDPARVRASLELIHAGARDAAGVVSRLREVYRPRGRDEALGPVDLTAIVERTIALTEPKWKDQALAEGQTVHIVKALEPTPAFAANEPELREALTNLIFNAVDALPDDGTITIRTRVIPFQRMSDTRGGPARAVDIEVQDTGMGMAEDVRQRCLEPFFTTKEQRGTGLGLSMVHGIVQRHDGRVEIESAPGRGTTVRLILPLSARKEAHNPVVPAPHAASSSSLRVLVVDDEPGVAETTAAYLRHDGHTVTRAANGTEALTLVATTRYDLVITDLAMPQMTGDQLAARLQREAPGVPVVLLTGFGSLPSQGDGLPSGVATILSKPLSLNMLRQAIRRVTCQSEAGIGLAQE